MKDAKLVVEKAQVEGNIGYDYFEKVDSFRERALLEIVSGKMADLYLVSEEDMRMLYEKGALADMTGILPPEIESCIYPGILECGVIDGKQIGLATQAYPTIVLASNEVWPKDSWTIEEALDLWDSHPEWDYFLIDPWYNYSKGGCFIQYFSVGSGTFAFPGHGERDL